LLWLLLLDGLFVFLPFSTQIPAFVLRTRAYAVVPMTSLGRPRIRREEAIFFCPRSAQSAEKQRRYEKKSELGVLSTL
jgi:hypothetical protein